MMDRSLLSSWNELVRILPPESEVLSEVPDWVRAVIAGKLMGSPDAPLPTHADLLGMLRFLSDAVSVHDDDPIMKALLDLEARFGS